MPLAVVSVFLAGSPREVAGGVVELVAIKVPHFMGGRWAGGEKGSGDKPVNEEALAVTIDYHAHRQITALVWQLRKFALAIAAPIGCREYPPVSSDAVARRMQPAHAATSFPARQTYQTPALILPLPVMPQAFETSSNLSLNSEQ